MRDVPKSARRALPSLSIRMFDWNDHHKRKFNSRELIAYPFYVTVYNRRREFMQSKDCSDRTAYLKHTKNQRGCQKEGGTHYSQPINLRVFSDIRNGITIGAVRKNNPNEFLEPSIGIIAITENLKDVRMRYALGGFDFTIPTLTRKKLSILQRRAFQTYLQLFLDFL